jgi:hypothetical protein
MNGTADMSFAGSNVLYGGTAITLHLGHRESVDFDFFGNRSNSGGIPANSSHSRRCGDGKTSSRGVNSPSVSTVCS